MTDLLPSLYLGMYENFCEEIQAEYDQLFSSPTLKVPREIREWLWTWKNAVERRVALRLAPNELIRSGRLLARVAESYTLRELAEQVFPLLEVLIDEVDPDELRMAEILIEYGELDRRSGRLSLAKDRFDRAHAVTETVDGRPAHKVRSRVFYEFAYIDLYSGDAGSAMERLARSEDEANLAGDLVGAAIARALIATVQVEEGMLTLPLRALRAETVNFAALAVSPEIIAQGRHGFANRWRMNCEFHEIQTMLAAGEIAAAREACDRMASVPNPSPAALASIAFIDGAIALAEGNFNKAGERTAACMAGMPVPTEKQETYATLVALYGIVEFARGKRTSAKSHFNEAMALDPMLRNARGQGWAALGLAIIAIDEDQRRDALTVLDTGIERCARCCKPVRQALQALRAELAGSSGASLDWKEALQRLAGPIPSWLIQDTPASD